MEQRKRVSQFIGYLIWVETISPTCSVHESRILRDKRCDKTCQADALIEGGGIYTHLRLRIDRAYGISAILEELDDILADFGPGRVSQAQQSRPADGPGTYGPRLRLGQSRQPWLIR